MPHTPPVAAHAVGRIGPRTTALVGGLTAMLIRGRTARTTVSFCLDVANRRYKITGITSDVVPCCLIVDPQLSSRSGPHRRQFRHQIGSTWAYISQQRKALRHHYHTRRQGCPLTLEANPARRIIATGLSFGLISSEPGLILGRMGFWT